ncbi:MAG: DUF1549 domain-containing protein, partial [Pirellulaceae bacterium]|nr:DUF1549 domain-containing protein [Pirellulaceae bacterium]
MNRIQILSTALWIFCAMALVAVADEATLPSIATRFAPANPSMPPAGEEVPSFQKHVSPLMGRLGCNGRACHGSFQGRGDFRLSLFGYDFEADHAALLENGRIQRDQPLESLVLTKPVDADMHEGGKRFEKGGWEYWVLRRWIEAKSPFEKGKIEKLSRLEVQPSTITFPASGATTQLKVIAHWESGASEDVTSLCRFQTNDPAVATVDEKGLITAADVGDSHVVVSYDNAVVPIEVLRPYSNLNEQTYPQVASTTRVDELVNNKLRRLGIVPSELATDEEFLRRASLDVTGTLPTAAEVLAFAADKSQDKRSRKIEELLERPGYAAQWATFFCDMTGNNDDQLRNFLPVQRGDLPSTQWYQWIHDRLEKDMPYDDLVEGIVTAKSRLPDETYAEYCESMSQICQDDSGEKFAQRPGLVHYWVRQNFRTPEEKAIGFAYTFLGVRIQCAQCHKHPFDQWTKSDFQNFERLFGGIQGNQNSLASDARKEFPQMVSNLGVDKSLKGNQLRKELSIKLEAGQTVPFPELLVNARTGAAQEKNKDAKDKKNKNKVVAKVPQARLLGGDWVSLDQADVRGKLMDWLRSPSNPYFAKALVNRVWAHYFSIGIVNPSDDLNLANAPSNAALFEYLSSGFVEHNFDLKWLHREILNSHTYQRSWIVNETNHLDKRNFSHSLLRRLPAEAAHDAVLMALANDNLAQQVASGGRSRALALAGASAQVRGGDTNYALSVFGRSVRETNCDCDRSNEPSLLQTVFLLNDASVQGWLSDPDQGWVASVAKQYGWTYKPRAVPNRGNPTNGKDKMAMNKDKMAKAAGDRLAAAQVAFEKQSQKIVQR